MSNGVRASIAGWALLSVAGWTLQSVAFTVTAPLVLLAIPLLVERSRQMVANDRIDPLQPIWPLTALFGFSYLVVPALAAIDPGPFSSLSGYLDSPPAQRQMASWLAAVSFLGLLAGYYGHLGERFEHRLPRQARADSPRRLGALSATLFAAGCASVAATVIINQGFSLSSVGLLTGELRDETVASFTGRGYLTVGFLMLSLSVPCTAMWAATGRGTARWVVVAGITGFALLLLLGIVGSRIGGLAALVGVLVVIHYRVRRLPMAGVVGAALAVLAMGVAIEATRGYAISGPLSVVGALSLTFDGFAFLVNTLAGTDHFLLGKTVGEDALLTYVPRELWADKPLIFGYVRAQELVVPGLYDDVGRGATFPVGIVAEGYLNFGVLGAVGFPFLAGVFIRALYIRLTRNGNAYYVLLMAWLLPNLLSLMRGLGATIPLLAIVAIVLSPLLIARLPRIRRA